MKNTRLVSGIVIAILVLVTSVFIFLKITTQKSSTPLFFQSAITNTVPSVTVADRPTPIVYGYLPYWTRSKATFPQTITHISYFSLGIQQDGKLLDIPTKVQEAGYRAYRNGVLGNLRTEIRSSQKLELTLTMMDQDAIPVFLQDAAAQDTFLTDLQTIISSQPIDGINIDIEYNGLVDANLQEKLTTLLHRTKILLSSQTHPLSLSIATYSDAGSLQRLTNLQTIAPEVDHIIMMAYDYHRSKSPNAGPNSPLYGKAQGKWSEDILNDLQQYTQYVPAEKILLGVPFYGYAWTVVDGENSNSFTLPKTGESVPYANVVSILAKPGVKRYWDTDAMSPYLRYVINGKTKILYYDDPESMKLKMELVKESGLGGIAIWALGYEESYTELLNTVKENIAP